MSRKQLLLDLLQKGHFEERLFCDGLSQSEKDRQGTADDWSPKDIIAHISYWKRKRSEDFRLIKEGGTVATIDDFDHENDAVFEKFREQSWLAIIAYSEEATAALLKEIDKSSDAELELTLQGNQPVWRTAFTNAYSHPLMHIAEYYQQHGDTQRAAEVTGMLGTPTLALDDTADWQGLVLYNSACSYALLGQKEEAIKQLAEALAIRPNLTEWSTQDSDLDSLRAEPTFQALYQEQS